MKQITIELSDTEGISKLIWKLRKAQGLTQAQLGEKIGTGKARIAKLEKNVGNARLSTLQRVFSALGYNLKINIRDL